MNNYANKVVWITGASSGIGKELAIQITDQGGQIILSARNEKALNELKNSLANSDKHMVLPLDLADNKHFDELAKQVIENINISTIFSIAVEFLKEQKHRRQTLK